MYDQYEKDKEVFDKSCNILYLDFLGYEKGQPRDTYAYKLLNELKDFYGSAVLFEAINKAYDDMMWAVNNKKFTTHSGKVKYLIAIIKNKAYQVYKQTKITAQREANKQADNGDIVDYIEEIAENETLISRNNDISNFLEEDDL